MMIVCHIIPDKKPESDVLIKGFGAVRAPFLLSIDKDGLVTTNKYNGSDMIAYIDWSTNKVTFRANAFKSVISADWVIVGNPPKTGE